MWLHCSHPPWGEHKFSPTICTRKLRGPATASHFQSAFKVKAMTAEAAVATISDAFAAIVNHVWSAWSKLKGPLLDAVTEVCGLSKNHQWRPETWARFLSLARSKLRLCSANHRAGYFSNLACDWLSIVWAYSEQETEIGPCNLVVEWTGARSCVREACTVQSLQ